MAEGLSFTAFLVAKTISSLGKFSKYRSLLTREQILFSKRFADECGRDERAIKLLHRVIGKRFNIWLVDNIAMKGLPLHYAARKKYIREQLDAVAGEVSQIVMVGAGFDTLCLEYHTKHPELEFFELDQPATQKVKAAAIKKIPGYEQHKNLHLIPCDLSQQPLDKVLKSGNIYNPTNASFFIVEGVFPYLAINDVRETFERMSACAASGSYVVFGMFGSLEEEGGKRAKLTDKALTARGEKYKSAVKVADMPEFLAASGFKLLDTRKYDELQEGYISPKRLLKLQKERGEHYYLAVKV